MPRFLVDAPDVTAWRYGLRSVSTVLTTDLATASDAEKRWTAGGVEYETNNCYIPREWAGDACTFPVDERTITVTFTAAPSGPNTVISAAATVDSGPVRQVSIDFDPAGSPVIIATGAAAVPVHTQAPSAAATINVAIVDVATGTTLTPVHQVTVSLAGAVTAGGTAELDISDPILKTFTDSFQMVSSGVFQVYAEDGCKLTGSVPRAADKARAKLAAGEQAVIERVVMRDVIAPGATNLTANAAGYPLRQAIGMLEKYAAANYAGMAFLHLPRELAPYMTNIGDVYRDSAVLRTILDSALAFGGGYDGQVSPDVPSVAPAAGKFWLYVTGQPVMRITTADVPAPTPATGGANLARNQLTVLAEKSVSVTVDCLRAGVLVDLTNADGDWI